MPATDRDDRGAQAAARALAEQYGLTCQLHALPGELDRNFACDGHVVKLHAPGADEAGLDLQVPDVVTLGKPIGNGHPLGAVVTTPAIARSFEGGMEYFNTFGGNPVSCAAGLAVLDVIADERLQAHAQRVGTVLLHGLRELAARHPLVADVRGAGLFCGVELRRRGGEPATAQAAAIVEHARRRQVLLSCDGPHRNVLKLKPPMVISEEDAARCVEVIDEALA